MISTPSPSDDGGLSNSNKSGDVEISDTAFVAIFVSSVFDICCIVILCMFVICMCAWMKQQNIKHAQNQAFTRAYSVNEKQPLQQQQMQPMSNEMVPFGANSKSQQ